MKIALIVSSATAVLASLTALYFYSQDSANTARLADYDDYVQQLLSQAESNSMERLQQEREISELRSELNTLNSQLTAVSAQLEVVEQQADPDYAQLEREIRRQVRAEYELDENNQQLNQRVDLIQQIASLQPMELSQVMAIQGQFGSFLQALDVNEERMEIIIGALSNEIDKQNRARQEIMQAAQNQEIDRREMRTQLREVMNPDTMLESLAYDLSDDELELLRETRAARRNQSAYGTFSFGGGDAVFIYEGDDQQGATLTAPALPIAPPPRNQNN